VTDYWRACNRVRGVDRATGFAVYCGKSYELCLSSAFPYDREIQSIIIIIIIMIIIIIII
jgi:hypothetical protein